MPINAAETIFSDNVVVYIGLNKEKRSYFK